jgi:hypothetical protein
MMEVETIYKYYFFLLLFVLEAFVVLLMINDVQNDSNDFYSIVIAQGVEHTLVAR